MTPAPRVAVCVPAYDEVAALTRLCRSIAEVDYPSELVQVVVAVDGADPAVVAAARASGARVVAIERNNGSYAARNAAVAQVEEPVDVVLFTDADCTVSRGWVAGHVEALQHADLSGGAVRFTFGPNGPTPAAWVDSIRHLKQELYVTRDGFAATCNLGVRRHALDVMTFDPTLRTGGDAEFCRRAGAAGFRLVYTETAWIEHPARQTRQELLGKVRRIAGGVDRQLERWAGRTIPRPRINRGAYRRARAAGHDVTLLWGLRACLLDYQATRIVAGAVRRSLASPPARSEGST